MNFTFHWLSGAIYRLIVIEGHRVGLSYLRNTIVQVAPGYVEDKKLSFFSYFPQYHRHGLRYLTYEHTKLFALASEIRW